MDTIRAAGSGVGYCQCGCGQKTTISTIANERKGYRVGQPRRYCKGHHHRRYAQEYLEEDRGYSTPCWIWQGQVIKNGYGRKWWQGKLRLAHRVYYAQAHGGVLPEQDLDHLCGQRRCVRPDHLEPVGPMVNARRGGQTKLTEESVRAIRAAANVPQSMLARQFNTTVSNIKTIRGGRTWKDVV